MAEWLVQAGSSSWESRGSGRFDWPTVGADPRIRSGGDTRGGAASRLISGPFPTTCVAAGQASLAQDVRAG